MYTVPSAHPAHFIMAIVAACAISVSLTSMAAITGLISDPTTSVRPPAFLKSLSDHLPGATPAASTAEPVAPPVAQSRKANKASHRKHRAAAADSQ